MKWIREHKLISCLLALLLALILIFIPSVSYAIARNYEKRYYKFVYFY